MKLSENFDLRELVAPDIYEKIGERAADWINANTIETLEGLRADFGPITINTWHNGGSYRQSGIRSPDSHVGSKFSSHKFGCGFDLKFSGYDAETVFHNILKNPENYPFISRMENAEITKTWLHIEITSKKRQGNIYVFNP